MTTNRQQINNNKKQQQDELTKQASEMLTIPTDMANMIINDIDPNAFVLWKQSCCSVMPVSYLKSNSMRIFMTGEMAENEALLARIFPVLEQAQDSKYRESGQRFKITLGMLIPSQKCGYVIGKERRNLIKVQNDFDIEVIIIDNGRRDPIPEENARLIIQSTNVEALRAARAEIRRLEAHSLAFNPFRLENGTPQTEQTSVVRERIRMPPWYLFNKEQKRQFELIQKTSRIDWKFDENQSFLDKERFLTLEGEANLMMDTKRRLGKLITEIEENERTSSTIRLFTTPTGNNEYRITFKVPTPVWQKVIGAGGRTIKSLRALFDVGMGFLGDNFVEYPEYRKLTIRGANESIVKRAREHIEREFIQNYDQQQHQQMNCSRESTLSTTENRNAESKRVNQTGLEYRDQKQNVYVGWGDSDDEWGASGDFATEISEDFGERQSTIEEENEKSDGSRCEENTCCWDEEKVVSEQEEVKEEMEKKQDEVKEACEEEAEDGKGIDEILLLLEHKNENNGGSARLDIRSPSDGIGTGDEYFGSASSSINNENQLNKVRHLNAHELLLRKAECANKFVRDELGPLLQQLTVALTEKENECDLLRKQLRKKENECGLLRERLREKGSESP